MNIKNHRLAAFASLAFGFAAANTLLPTAYAQAPQAAQLKVGDALPADALADVTWVQGTPVAQLNEPGKVYMLECLATWCGPCIAAIPHVNALHGKYADKGLVIIGMNVWEDGLKKAQKFVAKKGDAMAYRVAFSGGRKSPFADKVMKPAGVTGIPRALVVKDGKLVLSIHPRQIDDALVESLLDNSFDPQAFALQQQDAAQRKAAFTAKLRPLQRAGDWEGVKKLAATLDDSESIKFSLTLHADLATNNWPALIATRKDIQNNRYKGRYNTHMIDVSVAREGALSEEAKSYADIALADYAVPNADDKPAKRTEHHFTKARLLYMAGDVASSKKELALAKESIAKIDNQGSAKYYTTVVGNAIKAVDQGSFPDYRKLLRP
ncbi:TlpA family protein disulfide reductase [Verrucomicrobiaceae bacterium R5-34]|nr:TlpA family protein disulfide reductase [Verrucomicrobiaceae bacterium R5-34]